eukprot:m51a1_g1928 hypothetical protein (3697) ;mRNA; f:880111-891708
MASSGQQACKVFVGGISASVLEADLRGLMAQHGAVKDVVHRGTFAFVRFSTAAEATGAIQRANGTVLKGCRLRVAPATPHGASGGSGAPLPAGRGRGGPAQGPGTSAGPRGTAVAVIRGRGSGRGYPTSPQAPGAGRGVRVPASPRPGGQEGAGDEGATVGFVRAAGRAANRDLVALVARHPRQWAAAWQGHAALARADLEALVVTLARLGPCAAADVGHPPVGPCCAALRLLCAGAAGDEEAGGAAETVLRAVERLLRFEWTCSREDVLEGLQGVVDGASAVLRPALREHRAVQKKFLALSDELEKPWAVLLADGPAEGADQDSQQQEPAAAAAVAAMDPLSQWREATVEWAGDIARFCPGVLPRMRVPGDRSRGVYVSAEEYFDVVGRLWSGVTFCDGCYALNPLCRLRDGDRECGHVLWPLGPGDAGRPRCYSQACAAAAVVACCNGRHPYGLCARCAAKARKELRGPPGPHASTNVYDCVVTHADDCEGRLLLSEFASRKPPLKEIHWRTTKRLSCSNLVGVVKLPHKEAYLADNLRIHWAEVVLHDRTQHGNAESTYREKGKVAVSLLEYSPVVMSALGEASFERKAEFRQGDAVAIIDFLTFSPEHIPVLVALEMQKKSVKPFNNLQMLNILGEDPPRALGPANQAPAAPSADSEPGAEEGASEAAANEAQNAGVSLEVVSVEDSELDRRILEMILNSTLEPIVQVRRVALLELKRRLVALVRHLTLDPGQFESFVSAFTHPVHLTQGPPGTGKSYLGVAITRALLILRKMWIDARPDVGAPPILILSYKNHAIDELAVDLVRAESKVKMIRVGGGGKNSDPRLERYSERYHHGFDAHVDSTRRQLEDIFAAREQCRSEADVLSVLPLFRASIDAEDPTSSKGSKQSYQNAQSFARFLSCIDRILGVLSGAAGHNWEVQESALPADNYERLMELLNCFYKKDGVVKTSVIQGLCEGVKHYPKMTGTEVVWRWLRGFKPLPQCQFSSEHDGDCREIADEGVAYCSRHRCALKSCASYRFDNKRYCAQHMCQDDECQELRLKDPQVYCLAHACFVCLKADARQPAALAVDDPPRNTCDRHQLCNAMLKDEPCAELAVPGSRFCKEHRGFVCLGTTKKGKKCKSRPISEAIPYCKDHLSQAPKESAPQPKGTAGGEIALSLVRENSADVLAETPETTRAEEAKSKKLTIIRPCDITPAPEPEAGPEQEGPQKPATNGAGATPRAANAGAEDQGAASAAAAAADPDGKSDDGYEAVDTVDGPRIDNIDDVEEAEHLQHMRDVYAMEEDEEAFMHQGEATEDETANQTQAEASRPEARDALVPPHQWTWEMSLDERWTQVQCIADTGKVILTWLGKQLLRQAAVARKEHYKAKIRANSRVYQDTEVIAGTIVGCITRLEAIRATNPFAIVVEEASEVSEPLLFACLGPSTCKLELIGDHRQLQPSMMSKFDWDRISKMNVSMFERLVCAPEDHRVPFTVLSVQRRMRRDICDLTRKFYADITEIVDHPICNTKRIVDSSSTASLTRLWAGAKRVATTSLISRAEGKGREVPGVLPHIFVWNHVGREGRAAVGLSRANEYEAEMASKLVAYMIKCGVPKTSIAVLTPYKGQLMLIRKKLEQNGAYVFTSPDSSCRVSTVDRFQGDESDIVVVSLVIDEHSRTPFVQLLNRMIVLLSRARIAMYICANLGYFGQKPVHHWEETFKLLENPARDDTAEESSPTANSSGAKFRVYTGVQIGRELPICCPAHRTSEMLARTPGQLRLGFCTVVCDALLPCTHTCGLPCHWGNNPDKHNATCKVQVESPCVRHPQKLECHQVTSATGVPTITEALASYKCCTVVDVVKPCSHKAQFKCHEEVAIASGKSAWPICKMPSLQPYIRPACKHPFSCKCCDYRAFTENPSSVPPCSLKVDYTPACGHRVEVPCYLKQQYEASAVPFVCQMLVDITLPRCGHAAKVPCSIEASLREWKGKCLCTADVVSEGAGYGPLDYPCTHQVKLVLKCGHEQQMPCQKAFEMSERQCTCSVKLKVVNPECGHEITVSCHTQSLLQSVARSGLPPVSSVDEGSQAGFLKVPGVSLRCDTLVTVRRKCGHEERVSCSDCRSLLGPCTKTVSAVNLMCGHAVDVTCNVAKGPLARWVPWTDEFLSSEAWRLLFNKNTLDLSLAPPKPAPATVSLPACKQMITIRMACGHETLAVCSDAFAFLSGSRELPPCKIVEVRELECGHTAEMPCVEWARYREDAARYKCAEPVEEDCWNIEHCGQRVTVPCSHTDVAFCQTETNWVCSKGHSINLRWCEQGTPSDCPNCICSEIQRQIDACAHELGETEGLPAALSEVEGLATLETKQRLAEFKVQKVKLLQQYLHWVEGVADWDRPLFRLQLVPCFRVPRSAANLDQVGMTVAGFGIQAYLWRADVLKQQMQRFSGKAKQIPIVLGYGLSCRMLTDAKLPGSVEKRPKWVKEQMNAGYDAFLSGSLVVFWSPSCFLATHLLEATKETMQYLINCVNCADPIFVPRPSEFIKFAFPDAQGRAAATSARPAAAVSSLSVSRPGTAQSPAALSGTVAAGLPILAAWDGNVETKGGLFAASAREEEALWWRLHFCPQFTKGSAAEDPFSGINYGQKLLKKCPGERSSLSLLMALEFAHLCQLKDAASSLEHYADWAREKRIAAHPLVLLALARVTYANEKSKAQLCVQTFSTLYPGAVALWATEAEQAALRGGPDGNGPATAQALSVRDQWQLFQRTESCASAAMEKLLGLTGLEKVKRKALALFTNALAFRKMPPEAQAKNAGGLTLNFAFLGNPGTGKTTVARLLAEILRDSGMRKKSSFVECTSQKVKDDGSSEFRTLVASAMDGVLFIDEAHELDPRGDFKGKPIVAEILTSAENSRERLSIILAGYQDDMNSKLFAYNEGMKSRFEEVMFDDFSEPELREIWDGMLADKGWSADERASSIAVKRLAKASGRRGFGNARSVRKMFESATMSAMSRKDWSGVMELCPRDIIGECPDESNPAIQGILREFDAKVGWKSVKKAVRQMIELAKKNYDRELEGLQPLPYFVNRLFLGNPGTGKTTCAALYGRLLKRLNILSIGDVVLKAASDFVGQHVGESATKTNEILGSAQGKVLVIDEAYALNDNLYGKQVLDTLVEKVQGVNDDLAVLLLGYESQMTEMLRVQNPGLARRFPREYAFKFEDYSDKELLTIFNRACQSQNIALSSYKVAQRAIELLSRQRMLPNFGNAGAVNTLLQNAVAIAASRGGSADGLELTEEDFEVGPEKSADPFAPLKALFNVDNIIESLRMLKDTLEVAKREGDQRPEVGNFIFRGSPGTGKTTVARVMAQILFDLELLATNRIVEKSALQLTGEYLGQTKAKVAEAMGEAKGGILFVDEAYELGKGMFGGEAMTTLLEGITSTEYKGMVVVMAGYPAQMDAMLDRNPGMKSRFVNFIDFRDWEPAHAMEFFGGQARKAGFTVCKDAAALLVEGFAKLRALPGWGNGRDVVRIFKDVQKFRASRVASADEEEKHITQEDVWRALGEILAQRTPPVGSSAQPAACSEAEENCAAAGPQVQDGAQQKQSEREEQQQKQEADDTANDNQPEETSSEMGPVGSTAAATRDTGVTDEQWAELEEAKRLHQQHLDELLRERGRQALEEELRKQAQIREKIARLCPCPMGYSWTHVGGGWRCAGGSHFVTDKQLREQFTDMS